MNDIRTQMRRVGPVRAGKLSPKRDYISGPTSL